jgi:hypothetical protein
LQHFLFFHHIVLNIMCRAKSCYKCYKTLWLLCIYNDDFLFKAGKNIFLLYIFVTFLTIITYIIINVYISNKEYAFKKITRDLMQQIINSSFNKFSEKLILMKNFIKAILQECSKNWRNIFAQKEFNESQKKL